ncbi:hypothetical protein LTR97_009791 [Elasticomyces elasticus]|uniref:F-box domain-containing protein n=1 Tax=Elasticomyces elasticus TaxID=574655 RepID=A0AAN7ZZJ0_9PEZI|nr:hypothetical protein LTR97_009791 [Elasticomyces elasticus]
METSQSSQKRGRAGETDKNENIAKHFSKRVKAINSASSDVGTPKSIFDLPGELRNVVYGYVLDDLVAAPRHPYDKLPENWRFEDYIALLQTSRQVRNEVESLFLHGYLDRVTFYFTTSVELVGFAKDLMSTKNRWPLDNARFYLFQTIDVDEDNHEWELQYTTARLWKQQPGYKKWGNRVEGQYLFQGGKTPWKALEWIPEEHGFQHTDGSHHECSTSSYCKPFTVLKWPTLKNGCELAAYRWRAIPCYPAPDNKAEAEGELSGMSFEGRLAYLDYERFDMDLGIARLRHTRGEACG